MYMEQTQQLRKKRRLPQQKLAGASSMGSATSYETEQGECYAKMRRDSSMSDILQVSQDEVSSLWIAQNILEII